MSRRKLRADALEHGPNVRDWPRDRQLAAVAALLEADEATGTTSWLADMLAEAAALPPFRRACIDCLKAPDPISAAPHALAALRAAALAPFVLDHLDRQIALFWDWWQEEDRLERYAEEQERRADAAKENALWDS